MSQIQIDKLTEYRKLKLDLLHAIRDIDDMMDESTAIGSLAPKRDKIRTSNIFGARYEDIILDKVSLETIVAEELQRLQMMETECKLIIETVNGTRGRIVLTEYYLNCSTIHRISSMMHYDISTIKRIKRNALKQLSSQS